ncbi:MAG TPA: molybdopterin cofactor-binding domain-containing protein, partial [Candidatus Binatia bacterium]|nr:molybdopterin cofactor-binding domain-containing protein [Candidatus Binatia bacterium]
MSTNPAASTPTNKGFTRRNFLITTIGGFGGLCLGFQMTKNGLLGEANAASEYQINAYVRIGTDNRITILFGGCEFGQGSMTGLAQIVAEELGAAWNQVSVLQADASIDPVSGRGVSYPIVIDPCTLKPVSIVYLTGGSSATRGRYNALRAAGATAREMLINAGARAMGVSPSQCSAVDGTVVVNGTQTYKTFGELASVAANASYCPATVTLTDPANFRIIGEDIPRVDIPLKTNGKAIYGLDVRVPGMLYGVVKHCPTLGGILASTPTTTAGARYVFPLKAELTRGIITKGTTNAVAVLADNTWAAMQAAKSLKLNWAIPTASSNIDSTIILNQAKSLMQTGKPLVAESIGNADSEITSAINKTDSTYYLPYVPHVCMEVLNCTVNFTGNKCEVWAPTQSSGAVATTAKGLTGLNADQIIVHTTFLGGGLGRKFEVDFVSEAIQAAMQLYQKSGAGAVKVMWPRDEDFTYDQFRPMSLVRVQLGMNNGAVSLKYRAVSPSIRQQRQADPTVPLVTADSLAVEGAAASNYGFLARRVEHVWHPAGVPVGYWRSVGHSINSFVLESAIDELASKTNMDPLELRRQLLAANTTNPKAARALAVVNAAAELSPWRNSLPPGHAWGIAY